MGKSVVSKIKYYLPFATEAFSFRLTISIHFFPFVSSKSEEDKAFGQRHQC